MTQDNTTFYTDEAKEKLAAFNRHMEHLNRKQGGGSMRFISVDLECNQPSGTIIQIGAQVFDTTKVICPKFNLYIQPDETINWDHPLRGGKLTLGELLPLDQEFISAFGISSTEGLTKFWEWAKKQKCGMKIIQWGGWDMKLIVEQSEALGIEVPKHHAIDIKPIYKNLYRPAMSLPHHGALKAALKNLTGREFQGQEHNAYYDALNTGYIYLEMYKIIEQANKIRKVIDG